VRNLRENIGGAKAGTPSARFEEPVRKTFSNKYGVVDLAFFHRDNDHGVGACSFSCAKARGIVRASSEAVSNVDECDAS